MQEKIQSLKDNKVSKLVLKTEVNKNSAIKGRWVYKLKLGTDGIPVRFKARLVVKVFSQKKGVHYDETYAAVTKVTTLKLRIVMIAHYNLEARQYDIMTAFLYAGIKDHKIFFEKPHAY